MKNISGLHTSALVLSGIAPRIKHEHKTRGRRPRVLCSCFMLGVIPDKTAASVCNPYLSMRFHVSVATVSRVVTTWLLLLYKKFKSLDIWPSKEQVMRDMPTQFKAGPPPLEAISVIFGRRALFFFLFESS